MKRFISKFISIFVLIFLNNDVNAQIVKKVLFLGNSYTQVNDLPQMVAEIAHSAGDSLYYDSNTPGGYTFQLHSTNSISLSKINSNNWDYVVLQEQSQLPSFPPTQVQSEVFPYADSLNSKIKKNDSCTRTMFYMTWGRKNGDAGNCASYPPVCTYSGMQQRLKESYIEMGNILNAEICPAGISWKHLRQSNPSIDLYQADESHPSVYGTYLVACTFYTSIFHKSPVGLFAPVGISAAIADTIQRIAFSSVFDSIPIWRIDTANTKACFTFNNISGSQFQFTNCSKNAISYLWQFGDGSVSQLFSPYHNFSTSGSHTVRLYAIGICNIDSSVYTIDVVAGINDIINHNKVEVFPSPAEDYISIYCPDFEFKTVEIFASTGILISKSEYNKGQINISTLTSGYYMIRLKSSTKQVLKSFIKK